MIFVLIPAYNEAAFIGSTLDSLRSVLKKQKEPYTVVIVDDGSTDETAAVVKRQARKYPAKILRHTSNQGPGKAFFTGIQYVCAHGSGKDILITIEADNTNDAGCIPEIIHALRSGYDVACASRYLRIGAYSNFPLERKILSKVANTMLRIFFPIASISDYTLFFRGYTLNVLKKALAYYGDTFIDYGGFVGNTEIMIKLNKLGIHATEVPTTYDYIRRRGKSRMNVIKTIMEYARFISRFKNFR